MLNTRAAKLLLAAMVVLNCTSIVRAADPVSPLTATPTSVSLTYQKPSTPGASVDVAVTATNSTYFTVDPASVPIWLSVSAMSGTASSTAATLTLSPSAVAPSLGAGSYGGILKLKVTGYQDKSVTVSLVISNPAPTLSVSEGTTQDIDWSKGSAYPTSTLTLVSSNEPIAFTAVAAMTSPATPDWIIVSKSSGVAYNWGTPISVSFLQSALDAAAVGDDMTGTVTITPSGGTPIVVNYTISVAAQAATITRLFPSETPTQPGAESTDDPVYVVVTGAGFVASPALAKTVVTLDSVELDESKVTVVNASTMVLEISPDNVDTDGALTIGVQNPGVGSENTSDLTVTSNPIIYAMTDAASLVQADPGTQPKVAPYEIISIFGDSFGPITDELVYGDVDSFGRYPNTLTTAATKDVKVSFLKEDDTPIADAYLLFATKNQINALVPSGITGNTNVKIVVTFDGDAGTALLATVKTANPGIFTATSSGTGQAAILHAADYSVNSTDNKAAKGSTVLLYVSGMGAPNSTAANTTSASAPTFPAGCISTTAYMGTVNALSVPPDPAWTTIDGAVILAANVKSGRFAPCFTTTAGVKVTIGGKNASVTYAGWIAGGLAGLYQVNAVVPATVTAGDAVPVVVTVGTATSQSGVTMAVQ